MFHLKNLPLWERALRGAGGTLAAAYGVMEVGGIRGWRGGGFLPGLRPGGQAAGETDAQRPDGLRVMALAGPHGPLLEAARLGDPGALGHLLVACQPDIRRYAFRHCLAGDVDDAVQETLLIVTRHPHALRAPGAFSSWLFQVLRRECRRLERRLFGLDPFDEARMEAWLTTRPDEALRLDLIAALESLPAHYREVVLLRDFQELTIREIAARLQLGPAATKSRLHRARQMVREYLLG